MKIGFTGTHHGMTPAQESTVWLLLAKLHAEELHHGDCVGADAEACVLAIRRGLSVVVHPPLNPRKRACCPYCQQTSNILEPVEYLERNHNIVDSTEALIVVPHEFDEQLRSGTWATWRYAIKQRKPIYLVLPNGQVL